MMIARKTATRLLFIALALFCNLIFVQTGQASGFAVYTQGASALGQGNAVTAHMDDPSAVFFNPALIGNLPGTQVQIGTTLIHSSREFNSALSGFTSEVSSNHFPSTLYLTHQINPSLSLGVGVFSPFGLGTDWNDDWEGRYITTESKLTTFNINPVICWQVTPEISLAAGIDYLLLDATLEKKLLLAPLPDGNQKFTGDGDGLGFNLGAALKLTDALILGLHYRSEVESDLEGSAEFALPVGTPAFIQAMLSNTGGQASLTLPQQAQLGLAYSGFENLILEVGARWEDWSSFKSLIIKLDSGLTTITERSWKDVYAFNLGGKYQLNQNLALLAGYLFDNNPAPDDTFDPSIPTAKSHMVSVGSEMGWQAWRMALAYAYQRYESREKANSVGLSVGGTANGEYQTDNHMLALSLRYRFE